MNKKFGALIALLVTAVVTSTPIASASSAEHCVVRVIGRKPSGELITTPPECHQSYAAALSAAGLRGVNKLSAGATSLRLQSYRAQSVESFVIGTHYDGAGLSGASFSVVGDNCSGGWLNLSWDWDNRVSSTANGCYQVKHWDGDNLTGSNESTLGYGGNLSGLNNRANSIQYL